MTQPGEEKDKEAKKLELPLSPDSTEFIRLLGQYFEKKDEIEKIDNLRRQANAIFRSILRDSQAKSPGMPPDVDSVTAETVKRLSKYGVKSLKELEINKEERAREEQEKKAIAKKVKEMLPQLKIILKKVANDLILGSRSVGDAKIILRFLLGKYNDNKNFIDELSKKIGDFELAKLLEFKNNTSTTVVRAAFARVLRRAAEILPEPATSPK